jgi:AAA ATPase domain
MAPPWLPYNAGPMAAHSGTGAAAAGLTGRLSERDVLDRFVADVRAGEGRALVVRGEPGVGKTVLLDYLAGAATSSGCRVVRAIGVQSEMELAFAGLHQLCAPPPGVRLERWRWPGWRRLW